MWIYDKTLDIYRLEDNPNYYVDIEANKMLKTFYLCNEREDLSWKLISTSIHPALEEAVSLAPRLEEKLKNERAV